MIFYFSGTGNSKWIAKQLADVQKEQLLFIPDALRDGNVNFTIADEEKVGFVFPIYSWGPPPIILEFLRLVSLVNLSNQYVFFVCSCGDDVGLSQEIFCKALALRGWRCNAGFSVIMPNNYVLLPGFDVDRKEVENQKLVNAVSRIDEVNCLIKEQRDFFDCYEGRFPWVKTKIINPLFTKWGIKTEQFFTTSNCVACKRCEKVCPVNNIVMVDCKPVWGRNCTSCLACYHICPQRAVQYSRVTKKKGQYFNSNER